MARVLLIEDKTGAHDALKSALGLLGHDVVTTDAEHVRGRWSVAIAGAAHVERARAVSKRVVLLDERPLVVAVCDEVSRLLRS